MNNLIYLCVNGPQYRAMLDCCLGSLRKQGQFTGDIMVFCPDLCPVIQAACDKHQAIPRVIQWACPQMVERAYALRQMEVAVYDTVTCLDVDVVACRSLDNLLNTPLGVKYFNEPWQTYAEQPAPMYIAGFTAEEFARWKHYKTINVGHITWHTSEHGALRDAWIHRIEQQDASLGYSWGWDQATFNALIRCRDVRAKPYDYDDICNATKTPRADWSKYALCHFAGHRDRLRFMQELANT